MRHRLRTFWRHRPAANSDSPRADDVIVNTGTLADLEQFVLTLHRNYELLGKG